MAIEIDLCEQFVEKICLELIEYVLFFLSSLKTRKVAAVFMISKSC